MYPGIACAHEFVAKEVTPIPFREHEKLIPQTSYPAVNIHENPFEYQIQIAASGLKREDFKIELKDGIIFIAAQASPGSSDSVSDRCEFDPHDWARAFILPDDADSILAQAFYQNGELIIRIPKNIAAETRAAITIYVY